MLNFLTENAVCSCCFYRDGLYWRYVQCARLFGAYSRLLVASVLGRSARCTLFATDVGADAWSVCGGVAATNTGVAESSEASYLYQRTVTIHIQSNYRAVITLLQSLW